MCPIAANIVLGLARVSVLWVVCASCGGTDDSVDANVFDANAIDAGDAFSGEAGPPELARIALANFASRPDLQMVDVCAVPTGGGSPLRLGPMLGLTALTPGTVSSQLELAPGTYQFNAIDAASSDCTRGIRGYMGTIEPGADVTLVVAGGGTAEATALIGSVNRESNGRSGVSLLRTMILAVDTDAGGAVDVAVDAAGLVRPLVSDAFFWNMGFSPDADTTGYLALEPATAAQVVVRYRDVTDEIGRSAPFDLTEAHAYTAYVYPYAFRGAPQFHVLVCDETAPGAGGLANCR
jgi:hypothetical protein